jgi:hypothetical protein
MNQSWNQRWSDWRTLGVAVLVVASIAVSTKVLLDHLVAKAIEDQLARHHALKLEAKTLRTEIDQQLPLGSPRMKVEEWCARKGATPHSIVNSAGEVIGMGLGIPNECDHGVIRIEFHFDSEAKMTRFYVDLFVPSL